VDGMTRWYSVLWCDRIPFFLSGINITLYLFQGKKYYNFWFLTE